MSERYIPEHRRTQFKAKGTFKPEELRRRREEQQVEIRKAKRDENLAKRRGLTSDFASRPGASLGAAPDSDDDTAPTESQVRTSELYHSYIPFIYHGIGSPTFTSRWSENSVRKLVATLFVLFTFAYYPTVGVRFSLDVDNDGCTSDHRRQRPSTTAMRHGTTSL